MTILLAADIGPRERRLPLASPTGIDAPFFARIGPELLYVEGETQHRSNGVYVGALIVQRGYDGSSPTDHDAGAEIVLVDLASPGGGSLPADWQAAFEAADPALSGANPVATEGSVAAVPQLLGPYPIDYGPLTPQLYEQQTVSITGSPDGGSWTPGYDGVAALSTVAWNDDGTELFSALASIPALTGNFEINGGPFPDTAIVVSFIGALGPPADPLPLAVNTNVLTGGTAPDISIVVTQTGQAAALIDLFAPAVGQAIIDWWCDPATFVPFDTDTGNQVRIGRGPTFAYSVMSGGYGWVDLDDQGAAAGAPASAATNIQGGYRFSITPIDPSDRNTIGTMFDLVSETFPEPVRVFNDNGFGVVFSQGHADVYFLVATPIAP